MIATLEPNQTKDLSVSLTAPSAGLRDIVVSARGDRGLEQRKKISTVFEGISALDWQTDGTPVASVGQKITYTMSVNNPGSGPAKNVKLVADLPDNVEFVQAQPEFNRGQKAVFFNALEIPPKQSVTLKIVVIARKPGEARFLFEMTADGMNSGPLKHSKATTISPSGVPKTDDPTRIGTAPTKEIDPKVMAPREPDRQRPRKIRPRPWMSFPPGLSFQARQIRQRRRRDRTKCND